MKRFKKFMPLFVLAAFTHYSCINDADVAIPDTALQGGNGNLALSIEIPNIPTSRSAESSGTTEPGTEQEYKVNSLTVYLFDCETKTLKYQQELKNISMVGTADKKIQYSADRIEVNEGKYNIFAIANRKAVAEDITNQDNFLNAIDDVTYQEGKITSVPEDGFVMTNRGDANLEVQIDKPTGGNKVTTVTISLERAVAKIEVGQKNEKFPLEDPQGNTYCTITINNFKILNLAKQFYTFRHTAALDELKEPDELNFGKINGNNEYVIDPYFFKKTLEGANDFTNADNFFAQALVDPDINDNWAGMPQAESKSHIYCLENCMFVNAQLNAYSTGVMFKATMDIAKDRVLDEDGNVSTSQPAKLFYFNYYFYTSVNAIRKQALNNLPTTITDNSTTEELAKYSIKCFPKEENYSCYYNYWIKHEDNNSPEMGVMEFGIVRNNIYRLSISTVAGLGSGEPYIKPEQPDEYKAELEINMDVFPWAIRNQDIVLE